MKTLSLIIFILVGMIISTYAQSPPPTIPSDGVFKDFTAVGDVTNDKHVTRAIGVDFKHVTLDKFDVTFDALLFTDMSNYAIARFTGNCIHYNYSFTQTVEIKNGVRSKPSSVIVRPKDQNNTAAGLAVELVCGVVVGGKTIG